MTASLCAGSPPSPRLRAHPRPCKHLTPQKQNLDPRESLCSSLKRGDSSHGSQSPHTRDIAPSILLPLNDWFHGCPFTSTHPTSDHVLPPQVSHVIGQHSRDSSEQSQALKPWKCTSVVSRTYWGVGKLCTTGGPICGIRSHSWGAVDQCSVPVSEQVLGSRCSKTLGVVRVLDPQSIWGTILDKGSHGDGGIGSVFGTFSRGFRFSD